MCKMRLFTLTIFFISLIGSVPIFATEEPGTHIQMLPWDIVNEVLPKYSEFTVMDVESGKRFHVQRRAGNRHADVQPLTAEDTKIMKEIYDGKWTWRRKAIIVIHHDQWIAASMHGMPHGSGALQNNFPGHFCIHFYGSTPHRTNSMDLSHKLMILKSAGKLHEHLKSADPTELISAYIAGLKQRDELILSAISLQDIDWDSHTSSIINIKLNNMDETKEMQNKLIQKLHVDIEWINAQSNKEHFKGDIHLLRFSPLEPWKIDSERFLDDIDIQKKLDKG